MRIIKFAVAAVAACLLVTAGAAVTAAPADALTCGYLDDGNGAGSATSLIPGTTPASGDTILQENGGAWRVCYNGSNLSISLFADSSWCWAAPFGLGGVLVLRGCNGFQNQQWTIAGGNVYTNQATGGILCADGGAGSVDVTASNPNCSTYHGQWQFESAP